MLQITTYTVTTMNIKHLQNQVHINGQKPSESGYVWAHYALQLHNVFVTVHCKTLFKEGNT